MIFEEKKVIEHQRRLLIFSSAVAIIVVLAVVTSQCLCQLTVRVAAQTSSVHNYSIQAQLILPHPNPFFKGLGTRNS
jgi:hypothetical protein